MDRLYQKFAARVSRILGSPWTLLFVLVLLSGTGVISGFSENWRKFVDFTIAIGTFLILFFLQKSQNVGDKATHAKLDELIRAIGGARSEFAAVEDKHEHEIDQMKDTVAEECATGDDAQPDAYCEKAIENLSQDRETAKSSNR